VADKPVEPERKAWEKSGKTWKNHQFYYEKVGKPGKNMSFTMGKILKAMFYYG
jgi:hypothetical protein